MAKSSPYESGELTESIFLILLVLTRPTYGYRIMQQLKDMIDDVVVGPATMYTTLKKMKDAGWISEVSEDEGRILYEITQKGQKILLLDYQKKKNVMGLAKAFLEEEQ